MSNVSKVNSKQKDDLSDLLKLLGGLREVSAKNYLETDEDKQRKAIKDFMGVNREFSTLLDKYDVKSYHDELFWLFDGARNSYATSLSIGISEVNKKKLFSQGETNFEKISKILKTL